MRRRIAGLALVCLLVFAATAWAEVDEARRKDMDLRMAVYAAQIDSVDQGAGRIAAALTGRLAAAGGQTVWYQHRPAQPVSLRPRPVRRGERRVRPAKETSDL